MTISIIKIIIVINRKKNDAPESIPAKKCCESFSVTSKFSTRFLCFSLSNFSLMALCFFQFLRLFPNNEIDINILLLSKKIFIFNKKDGKYRFKGA
jgi:hypothetical protein